MGGAAAALAVRRSFWEVEEVDFVVRKIEKGGVVGPTAMVVVGGLREHQPWKLRWEVVWSLGDGGSPALADNSESEIIGVDCEVFGD